MALRVFGGGDMTCKQSLGTDVITASIKPIPVSVLRQLAEYLYLRKKDPNSPDSQWIKYMHGINRISLLMFLIGLVILFVKLVRK